MEQRTIEHIFDTHHLDPANSIEKIEIGFSNEVYLINDAFILKTCSDHKNEKNFKKEVYLYELFQDALPVPHIMTYDTTKDLCEYDFMIYPKIEGVTLYSLWHTLSNDERKIIIKQLCAMVRIINTTPFDEFATTFKIDTTVTWHDKILHSINTYLKTIEKKSLLTSDMIHHIQDFIKKNHQVLDEQRMALVHWDIHFDNILIKDGQIAGVIDFERIDISSIDHILDIVKRMMEYPAKYMAEAWEPYAKKEDYEQLMSWYRKYAPELFDFEHLDKRLDLYALEQDLKNLSWYPRSQTLRNSIKKTLRS